MLLFNFAFISAQGRSNAPRSRKWALKRRPRPLDVSITSIKESTMPDVTIVYWRDIPAQIIVGKGRRGSKAPLPERFEQAIDRAAMKIGAEDSDAYMAEWRKAEPFLVEGDADEIAAEQAARIDAEYDKERIKALIANEGWA